MKRIEKKTWPELFNKILSGEKTFDARIADFKIKEEDILVLREYDPAKKDYTGRKFEKKITFVLNSKDQKFLLHLKSIFSISFLISTISFFSSSNCFAVLFVVNFCWPSK